MEKEKSLIIWLVKGITMKFENVKNLENTDSGLLFNQINIAGFDLQI